ncbi:hypothetical protein Hanom_Chr07g00675811 [Helianthus anomalus]
MKTSPPFLPPLRSELSPPPPLTTTRYSDLCGFATKSTRGGTTPTLSNRSSISRLIDLNITSNASNQLFFTATAKSG